MNIHDNLVPLDEFDAEARLVDQTSDLLHLLFPHEKPVPGASYLRAARRVIRRAANHPYFRIQMGPFIDSIHASDVGMAAALTQCEGSEEFRFLLDTSIYFFYADPDVWTALGYEGESDSRGGYAARGFDDLAWLPTPRIEEYDERLEPIDLSTAPEGENK